MSSLLYVLVMVAAVAGYYYFVRMRAAAGSGAPSTGSGTSASASARKKNEQRRLLPPDLGALHDAATERGELGKLSAWLIAERGDWDARGRLVEAVGPRIHRSTLDAWCTNEAGSQIPFLLRGSHGIDWAWEARGSGGADTVTSEGQALFMERLQLAEADLQKAAALDREDPTPWGLLICIARGLEQGINHAGALYREACERDAQNAIVHRHMLTMLTAKWHGSHEAMLDFARAAAQIAPEGSDMAALVIRAHLERWFYTYMFDDDDPAAEAYLKDPQVVSECAGAWARSLGSRALEARPSTLLLRNDAAFWFWLIKDAARLKQELQHIGDAHSELFWSSFGDAADVFAQAKALANGKS